VKCGTKRYKRMLTLDANDLAAILFPISQ